MSKTKDLVMNHLNEISNLQFTFRAKGHKYPIPPRQSDVGVDYFCQFCLRPIFDESFYYEYSYAPLSKMVAHTTCVEDIQNVEEEISSTFRLRMANQAKEKR